MMSVKGTTGAAKRKAKIVNRDGESVRVYEWDDPAAVFCEGFNRRSELLGGEYRAVLAESTEPKPAGVTDA